MKKALARYLAEKITKSAEKSARSRKSIVGSLPLPQELKKGE
ncbi:hypothetical protein [Paenibacillus rhizophilus]|nr:hypothetical protein [Paenibacillus rhizophilus]